MAWARALKPGHVVSCDGTPMKIESCTPIWGLDPRGSILFSICMESVNLFDSLFDTGIAVRIEIPVYSTFVRLGMKRIVDFEVRVDDGLVCSVVRELNPIL